MNNLHNERYDEIKSLLQKSRMIMEQSTQINVAKDVEKRIEQDNPEYETAKTGFEDGDDVETMSRDKKQKYRISGGILAIHGKTKAETDITSDDKVAFQDTMDEFTEDVSDLVDFNQLNVYSNNVEWSGKIIDKDLEFIYTIGESSGTYINGDMVKVDDETLELINKLKGFYEVFKSKWSKVLVSRKQASDDRGNETN
jgi:hypothetical protein